MRLLTALGTAVTLLSTFRFPVGHRPTPRHLGESTAWFPLVGMMLGIVGLVLLVVSTWVGMPNRVIALLVLASWAILSGGLHWDGFGDVLDSVGVRYAGRERMLEVMKDPSMGAFAVLGMVLVLLCQWECLSALLVAGKWWPLLLVPTGARWALTLQCVLGNPARPGGTADSVIQEAKPKSLLIASLLWLLALFASGFSWSSLSLLLAPVAVVIAVRSWSDRYLGGQTGDVLGFTVITTETLLLICLINAIWS
ncbi:Cobalamin synthase [Planctomycetes bacterium Pan216]|uniref:Adenosylcobinamide-GDP ribazoletransferase n=1 Tax=Kolteria novifilia TaxID=2527975 RepID=A0A518AYQ2_9BACT|nr:Cobalamin synthase [Planctomycetes bacterium Pan216]